MTGLETHLHRRPTDGVTFTGAYNPNVALWREERDEHLPELPSLDPVRTSCTRSLLRPDHRDHRLARGPRHRVRRHHRHRRRAPRSGTCTTRATTPAPAATSCSASAPRPSSLGAEARFNTYRPPDSSCRTARWPDFWPRTEKGDVVQVERPRRRASAPAATPTTHDVPLRRVRRRRT